MTDLLQRLKALERRVAVLEEQLEQEEAPKKRGKHCRWVTDNGFRFWLPECYGGIYGPEGCYCR